MRGKSYFCKCQHKFFCQIIQNMTIAYDNKLFILTPSPTFDRTEFSNICIGFL